MVCTRECIALGWLTNRRLKPASNPSQSGARYPLICGRAQCRCRWSYSQRYVSGTTPSHSATATTCNQKLACGFARNLLGAVRLHAPAKNPHWYRTKPIARHDPATTRGICERFGIASPHAPPIASRPPKKSAFSRGELRLRTLNLALAREKWREHLINEAIAEVGSMCDFRTCQALLDSR